MHSGCSWGFERGVSNFVYCWIALWIKKNATKIFFPNTQKLLLEIFLVNQVLMGSVKIKYLVCIIIAFWFNLLFKS